MVLGRESYNIGGSMAKDEFMQYVLRNFPPWASSLVRSKEAHLYSLQEWCAIELAQIYKEEDAAKKG